MFFRLSVNSLIIAASFVGSEFKIFDIPNFLLRFPGRFTSICVMGCLSMSKYINLMICNNDL